MRPRIAIPMPHSSDREYGERAIPQYERAVALAGGEPVRIPLDLSAGETQEMIRSCDGVLLPGSNADVNAARFDQAHSPHSAPADSRREDMDWALLDDAYERRKPVLGICYGLQSLNVYRHGSLIQHIPEVLPEAVRHKVNHEAGRKVAVAHSVEIVADSRLGEIVRNGVSEAGQAKIGLPVNSSHHQSAARIGEGLRVVGHCPDDAIIEAVESTSPDHFVIAVQWHPERSVDEDRASRSIFEGLTHAAAQWREREK